MKVITNTLHIKRTFQKTLTVLLFLVISSIGTRAADYYWVGGSGNWSDYGNHWATSSGGNIFHTTIPTLNDDVYFDAASFTAPGQLVVFDNTFIYCNNMDWSGVAFSPSASGFVSNLHIYGSLNLVPGMTWNVRRVDFNGTGSSNSLASAGNSLDTLYFNGTGSYELLDAVTCKSLYIYNGSFSTGNFPVTTLKFIAGLIGGTVNVNLGTSVITVSDVFRAYDGVINLTSSNADLIFANPVSQSIFLWSANHTFRNLDFQARGEVIGNFACERLTASGLFYINSGSTTSVCQTAEFSGSTTLSCTFIVDSLTVLNSGRYLKVNQIIINDYFSINGVCGNPNRIQPIDFNPLGTITMAAGAVVVDYCIITSINATGGASFTANNSIDGGGNSGWAINSPIARTLYWVGGTGNWNDENRWAVSSGGTGGNCIPSAIDNVIFDALSFPGMNDTVILNGVQATCLNMDWSGATNNPTLAQTALSNLFISGSLTLSADMNPAFSAFHFTGDNSGNTIFTAGQLIAGILINSTGDWTLLDDLNINNIQVYKGSFNSNGFTINAKVFAANGIDNSIFVDFANSTVNISEHYMAFSPVITITSTNADLVFAGAASPIYCQINDAAQFNTVTVQNYTYFYATMTCNRFESFSGVRLNHLNTGFSQFHQSFTGLNIVADSMILMPDVTKFSFDTLEIGSEFIATPDCYRPLTLNSYSTGGQQSLFIKNSGIVNIEYAYIGRTAASGGAVFNATNCWDIGNNSGWNFTSPPARDLYWVGGGGEWDDPAHWALSSNGAPGNCPPALTDNIFFDSNSLSSSGETINVDPSLNVFCNDFTFSGIPSGTVLMSGASSPFFVNGSVALVPELDPWSLYLNLISASTGNTIHTGNNNIYQLRTSGTGEWGLQSPINTGNLFLQGGTFRTNGYNITTGGINTGGTTLIDFGTSTVSVLGFYSQSPSVVIIGGDADIIMNSSVLDFRVYNGHFNSVTFTGNANTFLNFSCNRLIAMGEFVNVNSQITTGYAEFKNKVTLSQNFVADTLVFDNPGRLVRINNLTVNDSLTSNGNAGFPVQIEGYNGTGTLTKGSGVVCLDHVLLKDIAATGGAQFFAGTGSVDLGGNSGWTFGVCSPLTVVWPGDANYDLVADNNDILNIGLAYGYNGPVRANASLAWVAQPATDWSWQFANGANLKHADTDGNGMVDADDTLAVWLNYGLTHPLREVNVGLTSLPSPLLYVVANPDTVLASDTVMVDIFLGDNIQPVDSIYGIAFTVNLDTALINTTFLTVDFSGCWMGTPQVDLLTFHKDLLADGKVDYAIVRTDQLNTSGFGLLTRMGIVIVDNVGAKITTPVTITNIKAITASEYLLSIVTEGDSIVIDTTGTTGVPVIAGSGFTGASVYPNPAKDMITIDAGKVILNSVEVYSLSGKLIHTETPNRSKFTFTTSTLNHGTYFIRLISGSGVVVKKIEVLHK